MCAILLCAHGFAETDDILARIYEANRGATLYDAHESQMYIIREKGLEDIMVYMDRLYEIIDSVDMVGGIRVRSSSYDYLLESEGTFARLVTFELEDDPWQFYNDELFYDEVLSVEEDGDTLVVTTKLSDNPAAEYYPDAEGVSTREVHVVDAKTLELQSFRGVAVFADGTEETYYEITVEYDVDRPHTDIVEAIEKHLFEYDGETRTTTMIFDDGMPCKRTYVYETPVGDHCAVPTGFCEFGMQYQINQERSTYSNEAMDNDAVYYLERVPVD